MRTNDKAVSAIEMGLPTIEEQQEIAELLQHIGNLISLNQKEHDKLVTTKQAMLQKMFPKPGRDVPEVRFGGFEGTWELLPFSKFAVKHVEKNAGLSVTETFTNSATQGIVSQLDYFDNNVSNDESIGGYFIVEPDYYVYNPRISATAPVGPIKRNKLGRVGVMSPLYLVFSVDGLDHDYLDYFFETDTWHPYMKLNGDSGARSDRFSIKDAVFFAMPIPVPSKIEQQAIGSFFTNLDQLISLKSQELDKLKQVKSALLQKMFV